MNRFVRNDPAFEHCKGRDDCLHVHIDYFDNPYCEQGLIDEANELRKRSESDYRHEYLGEPLSGTTEYLFNADALARLPTNELVGDDCMRVQVALAVDFAGGGGDNCVASILTRRTNTQWELTDQRVWQNPDTDFSVGKTIAIYGEVRPDVFVVDAGGLGYPMFCTISNTIPSVIGFDGAKTDKRGKIGANNRAGGYLILKDYVERGNLISKSQATTREMESIRKVYKSNGEILIESKQDMRKRGEHSPDRTDSLMMAVWGIEHYLGQQTLGDDVVGMRIQRVNKRSGY